MQYLALIRHGHYQFFITKTKTSVRWQCYQFLMVVCCCIRYLPEFTFSALTPTLRWRWLRRPAGLVTTPSLCSKYLKNKFYKEFIFGNLEVNRGNAFKSANFHTKGVIIPKILILDVKARKRLKRSLALLIERVGVARS